MCTQVGCGGQAWGQILAQEAAHRSRSTFPAAGLRSAGVGRGATRLWLLPALPPEGTGGLSAPLARVTLSISLQKWGHPQLSEAQQDHTHSPERRIQGPVAEAVLQEKVELLLDKPRDGGPAGEELGRLSGSAPPGGKTLYF